MKNFFCTVITFTSFTNYNFYSIAPLSFLTSKTLLLFFLPKSYFWMLSSTFNFFIDILFRIIIVCKCYTTFNVLLLFSNDRWVCDFSLCPRVSGVFFPKTLISLYFASAIKRCSTEECSCNVRKVVEKIYFWAKDVLIDRID